MCENVLIHAFVTSKLDYCNSLLCKLPNSLISRLQKLQNIAARMVTRSRKLDHISPILTRIHWLPIPLRIKYKILLITFKCINGHGPSYLSELIEKYVPQRTLRSSCNYLLKERKFKLKSYGERAFIISAPKLWNALPLDIRCEEKLSTFKSRLKTHLFQSFSQNPSVFIF